MLAVSYDHYQRRVENESGTGNSVINMGGLEVDLEVGQVVKLRLKPDSGKGSTS